MLSPNVIRKVPEKQEEVTWLKGGVFPKALL